MVAEHDGLADLAVGRGEGVLVQPRPAVAGPGPQTTCSKRSAALEENSSAPSLPL
jgi:hypothetical protein